MSKENETDDRPRGILTPADRAYLQGERELTEGSEFNTQRRIRQRVYNSILDFTILFDHMDEQERQKVFGYPYPLISFEDQALEDGLRDTLAFVLYTMGGRELMTPTTGGPQMLSVRRLLKDACYRVGKKDPDNDGQYLVQDIEFNVDATRFAIPNLITDLEEGRKLSPGAIRFLLETDEVDTGVIQEHIREMVVGEETDGDDEDSPVNVPSSDR